jgi:hypothetical protein
MIDWEAASQPGLGVRPSNSGMRENDPVVRCC